MWTELHSSALSGAFEALNGSGIRWMVLRNYEGLPESNRSKDIDLVLGKKDFATASSLIDAEMQKSGFVLVDVIKIQYVWCRTYFSFLDDTTRSLKIDLLDGFVWRGAEVLHFDEIYRRKLKYKNFSVPSRVDDAFMLWAKPIMTGAFIKAKYEHDILESVVADSVEFKRLTTEKFGHEVSSMVWPMLEAAKLQDTVLLYRRLRLAAWTTALRSKPLKTVWASIEHVIYEVKRRSMRPKGSMIAVVGPDGVGKTTFINLLHKQLAEVLVKEPSTIKVRHFRPNLLPNLKKLFSPKTYDETTEEFSNPHRAKPAGFGSSLMRLAYYWLDYVLGYYAKIRSRCIAGEVYIFDRYFYDFIVDPRRARTELPEWIRLFFMRITPKPDVVFFLDCDADVVFSRKQELERDEIARQLDEYRKLSMRQPQIFAKLNALQAPAVSCANAVRTIVERSFPPI